ncbi:MAG: hypothetical protein NDI61_14450 [Bdellovibrionaceae bacterium]|nr:hypothetical protein [Pseudobdellovibrionaceae bacterium]
MKALLLVMALSFLGSSANAFIGIPGELTPVVADIHCEQEGGGIAIAFPKEGQPARVWQTDIGSDDGLELEVLKFNMGRCPGCFAFQAKLMGYIVFGEGKQFHLKYWAYDEDKRPQVLLETACRESSKRFLPLPRRRR